MVNKKQIKHKYKMKNLKSREDFLAENAGLIAPEAPLTAPLTAVNEKSMTVHVDAKDTKPAQEAIKKAGAKVIKATDFGTIDIETDPKLVDEIKSIEDVTAVEEIKKSK